MTDPNDAAHFRNVLSSFASGVTVITAMLDGEPVGMTCQSFFSLSLDPPLIAFAPGKGSTSYPRIRQAGSFCINILAEGQSEVCLGFARSGSDKWAGVEWTPGQTGSPVIQGVQSWIDCTLETEHDAGDHFITVGRVVALESYERPPLVFYKGRWSELKPS